MKRGTAFPSQFVSKADVEEKPIRGAVKVVQLEEIRGESGLETKPVLYLSTIEKGMVLNGVNWDTIAGIAAEKGAADPDDSDHWTGIALELYHDPSVMFGKRKVGGVRIRKLVTRPAANPRKAPPKTEPEASEDEGWQPPGDADAPGEPENGWD